MEISCNRTCICNTSVWIPSSGMKSHRRQYHIMETGGKQSNQIVVVLRERDYKAQLKEIHV